MAGSPRQTNILVIGAGVSGLSAAVCIQRNVADVKVTVMSEHFPPEDIVSMVAGGVVLVGPREGLPVDAKRIVRESLEHFEGVHKRENALVTGVLHREGYFLNHTDTYGEVFPDDELPLAAQVSGKYRVLTDLQCQGLMPDYPCSGWSLETYVVDGRRYLLYLLNQFHSHGGIIQRARVDNLQQISLEYDVVINCTGLGSRNMINDTMMSPIKGHIMRFATEGKVNHFMLCNKRPDPDTGIHIGFYMIPHSYDTIVGGTYDLGNYEREMEEDKLQLIEKYARRTHTALSKAPIIQKTVGFRPFRSGGLRIEREDKIVNGRTLVLIHNYGHEGVGVGLSWGSAMKVTSILKEALNQSVSASKL